MNNFMKIWLGELISCIGSGMTAFAVSIYVYQQTKSATLVAITALLAFLPAILLSPLGGVLADRHDRRLMMILGDSLSVIGLLVILFSIHIGYSGILPIYIGITISSVFSAFLEPAYRATITDLLTEDEYAKASGLVQIAANSKYLISPFLAGIILSRFNIEMILLIDIGTFFITVFTIYSVRKKIQVVKKVNKKLDLKSEFREGMTMITSDKTVKSLVLLMAGVCFFIAFIQTLMAPMILAFSDAKTLGIMESVSAMGMLVGSVIIGIIKLQKGYLKVLVRSLMATGLFMALAGTTTHIWMITAFCFLFFTALPFVNTCADVLIRIKIPNEVQGRVWGLISILTQSGFLLAYVSCGLMADYIFGPMLMKNGILAGSVGKVIGIGEGRGIGFMLILSGMILFLIGLRFNFNKNKEATEGRHHELVHI